MCSLLLSRTLIGEGGEPNTLKDRQSSRARDGSHLARLCWSTLARDRPQLRKGTRTLRSKASELARAPSSELTGAAPSKLARPCESPSPGAMRFALGKELARSA